MSDLYWNVAQLSGAHIIYSNLIDRIESVQRRFTRMIPGLKSLTYVERLIATRLESLELRRMPFDLILLCKN